MRFESARAVDFEVSGSPDSAGLEAAVARFDSPHPYLLFHFSAVPEIRSRAAANPQLEAWAARLLSEPSLPRDATDMRTAIKRRSRRLVNLAFVALTAEVRLAKPALAATRRMLAELAAAPTWRERQVIHSFLDCGEIARAVALAYDWLFEELTQRERHQIEDAIRRHVLEPALVAYQDRSLLWPRRRDNCTAVSNCGIILSALCALRFDRAVATRLLRHGLASSWNLLSSLVPDGAWREGLSYWSLAMRHAGLMVAALESTLGSSFGLADLPGFGQTGDFALHAAGPFGAAFNFGDSEEHYEVSPLVWFAHRFGRAVDDRLLRDHDGWRLPFGAIWPSRSKAEPITSDLPTGKIFRNTHLACFRNTWSAAAGARPVYLAIKGGNVSPRFSSSAPPPEEISLHSQADAGTFIVDGARHRWVLDMGSDDYDLPGYFDHGADGRSGRRWQYYRAQSAGHNTLAIGGREQIPNAPAPIIGGYAEGDNKWVVLDLSRAYGQAPGQIRRGAALLGREIIIQDEIDPTVRGEIIWRMHTAAEPEIVRGSCARLRIGTDRLTIRILEPDWASFELSAPPPSRGFALGDVRHLHGRAAGDCRTVSELPRCADEAGRRAAGASIWRLQIVLPTETPRVTVLLLPDCDGNERALPVAPLDQWLARRPVRLVRASRRGHRVRTRAATPDPASSSRRSKLSDHWPVSHDQPGFG